MSTPMPRPAPVMNQMFLSVIAPPNQLEKVSAPPQKHAAGPRDRPC
jgi:hypothetical protein